MLSQAKFALQSIRSALTCKKGVTAIEYGLIAAGVALVVATAMPTIKSAMTTTFNNIGTDLGK